MLGRNPYSVKRLRKRFGGVDFRLVMSATEIAAYLDVLDTLAAEYRWDFVSQTYVRDIARVRDTMNKHRAMLASRATEMSALSYALTVHAGYFPHTIPVARDDAAAGDDVALSPKEIRFLAIYPHDLGHSWNPKSYQQERQWIAHFNLRFSGEGPVYLHLCRERLRMILGTPTRCRMCSEPVLPRRPRLKESDVPLRAGLCETCALRELRMDVERWYYMSLSQRDGYLPRLQKIAQRGPSQLP